MVIYCQKKNIKTMLKKDRCILSKEKYKDNKKKDENNCIRNILTQMRDYFSQESEKEAGN